MRTIVITAFFCCSSLHAQVYFGNRGGVSIAKQVLNDRAPVRSGEDYGYELLGGHVGVTLEIPFTDRSSAQVEIGYVEKGYRAEEFRVFFNVVPEQLFRIGYADLSALYKWSALSGNLRPEVFAGPVIARTLRLRDEIDPEIYVFKDPVDPQQFFSSENRAVDHLASWEFSAVAGAGFILQPGVGRVHINYRYIYGLSNIYRYDVEYADRNGVRFTSGSQFNRTHLITVGWSIPLSREAWDETPSAP